jgi:exonuclease SbcC
LIPVALKLHNFKSFADEDISFEGLNTVAISGNNGAGKTSIVDAITWALWENAMSMTDVDSIVHKNKEDVEVQLDFEFNNDRYRVIRKRKAKNGKSSGSVVLNFMRLSYDNDGNEKQSSLNGQTKTQTEKAISDLLHLDYKTFISSAFIQQGHSDEFNSKSNSEKKEILSKILSLEKYDEYQRIAKEKKNTAEQNVAALDSQIKNLQNSISLLSGIDEKIQENNNAYSDIIRRQKETNDALIAINSAVSKLEASRDLYNNLQTQLKTNEDLVLNTGRRIKTYEAELRDLNEITGKSEDIQSNFDELEKARKTKEEQTEKRILLQEKNNKKSEINNKIIREEDNLKSQIRHLEEQIEKIKSSYAKLPGIEQKLAEYTEKEKDLSEKIEFRKEKTDSISNSKKEIALIQQNITAQNDILAGIEEKLTLLSHHEHDTAKCPLCESELGEENLQKVTQKLTDEKSSAEDAIKNLKYQLSLQQNNLSNTEQELKTYQNVENERKEIQEKMTGLSIKKKEVEDEYSTLSDLEKNKKSIEEKISKKEFCQEERVLIDNLNKEIQLIGFDSTILNEAIKKTNDLKQFETLKFKLENASQRIPTVSAAMKDAQSELEKYNREKDAIQAQIKVNTYNPDDIALQKDKQKKLQAQLDTIQAELSICDKTKGQLIQQKEQLEKDTEQLKSSTKDIERYRNESGVYDQLVTIFGDKGIKALIIDSSLPELNREANNILSKMTNNEMSINFASQRQTTKGTSEEITITIWQNGMDRDYTTYSGGERFRIDLACRIAMSRLLTNRVGAPMQTLIIDEGFGTQDEEGIEKVISAINSIRNEFNLIMVITHIDALREAFPDKIVVEKSDGISHITRT